MLRWTSRNMFGKAAAVALGMSLLGSGPAFAQAVISKANNTTNLDQGASWVGGLAPTNLDTALWDATVVGANSTVLGTDQSWAGLRITNPGGLVTIGAGNTLTLGAGGIDMSGATQSLTLNNGVDLGAAQSWNVGAGRTLTVGGVISEVLAAGATLTKSGAGALTLTNGNTYGGPTNLRGGTVNLNFNATTSFDILPATTALIIGGTQLNATGFAGAANTQTFTSTTLAAGMSTISAADGGGGGTMTVNLGTAGTQTGATVRFVGPATQDAAGSPVAATGAITGTFATSEANGLIGSYVGVEAGSAGHAGAGFATIGLYDFAAQSGGTVTGISQLAAYVPLTAGLINGFGTPAAYDLQANITNSNAGSQKNAGVVRFNTPGATTITGGTGNLFTASALLITPNMGVENTALTGNGTYQVIRQTNPSGPQQGTIWQNNTQAFFSITMPIINGRDAGDPNHMVKAGQGTAVFSGVNTYTGGTHLNEGSLMITANNNLGADAAPVFLAGGTLVANGSFNSAAARNMTIRSAGGGLAATAGNTLTVDGVIADDANGGGGLTIGIPASAANGNVLNRVAGTGAGTGNATALNTTGRVILSNANTYAGGTNILGGTLLATNTTGSATGTGAVSVGSGAGFGGTGTVTGLVTATSGGHITPGVTGLNSGIGAVTVSGGLTALPGSILDFDMTPAQNDMIVSGNGFNISAPLSVNLFQAGTADTYNLNGTYTLLSIPTGTIPSALQLQSNLSIANAVGGGSYTWGVSGTNVTLTIGGLGTILEWDFNGGGAWGTAARWNPDQVPNTGGDAATLGNFLLAGTANITLDAARTVGQLAFNNTNGASYSVDAGAGGSLVMNNFASGAVLAVVNGSHAITAPITLVSDLNASVTNALDTLTLSGNISGAKNISAMGAGRIILSGSNSHVNTAIGPGLTLQVGTGGTAGTLGSGTVSLNGTLEVNRSNAVSLNAISGTGTLVNNGAGTTTLSAANTGAFGVTVNAGKIVVGAGSNLGTGPATINAGTLDVNGTSPTVSALAGTSGTLDNSSATPATFTANQVGNTTFNGTLADSGAGNLHFVKSGAGVLTYGGTTANGLTTSSYNAGAILVDSNIRVDAGQVILASNSALPAGKVLESRVSGVGVMIGGTTTNIAGTILIHPDSATSAPTFDVVAGTAATLSGTMTTPPVMTSNGAQIRINAGNDTATSLTVTGTMSFTVPNSFYFFERGNFTFAGNSQASFRNDMTMFRGAGGDNTITIKDNAQFTSGVTHPTPGVGANSGHLSLAGGGGTAPVTAVFTLQDSATVTSLGGNFELNGAASGSTTVNLNGGTLSVATMTKAAATPTTLAFNGTQIVSRGTGILVPATVTALVPGTDGAVVKAGGVKVNTNGFDSTVDAALAHESALLAVQDGGLTKSGAGKLVLSGANTYAGATTVNGGTLEVNGTHGANLELAPVADYALNAGGRLAGAGTIGDGVEVIDITVNNGGIVAPGAYADSLQSPGTLNVSGGNVIFGAGGRMEATVSSSAGSSDVLALTTGTINLTAANNVLKIQGADSTALSTAWTIATAASVTGTFEAFTPGYTVTYPGGNSILVTRTGNSADFDFDGDIDGHDFLAWQRGVGTTTGAVQSMGDANLDGAVDVADLTIWKGQFATGGALLAATAAVPEPAMLALVALAVPALVSAGRRRGA
jgi:fibronectin-binding autotransporter adhesin